MNHGSINISPVKRVAALHDLSGFGRCALTVIIPVLSVMGVQTVPVPTAVMSTHTGGYTGFSFASMTDEMKRFTAHYQSLGLRFDSVYTGFFGDAEQFDVAGEFIDAFGSEDCFIAVDPVLGDEGRLYSTVTDEMIGKMKRLCARADLITPNITEAKLLLGIPQSEARPYSELLDGLISCGARSAVITGIHGGGCVGTAYRFGDTEGIYNRGEIPAHYPGTGDIFAAVLIGRLLSGTEPAEAARFASDFTAVLIRDALDSGVEPRTGVPLERNLWRLCGTHGETERP